MRLIIFWPGQEIALFLIRALAITDTRCYFSIVILSWHVILSSHDNTKLWQQLQPGFRRATNSNKNQLKLWLEDGNHFLLFTWSKFWRSC